MAKRKASEEQKERLVRDLFELAQKPDAVEFLTDQLPHLKAEERVMGAWMLAAVRWIKDPRPWYDKAAEFPQYPREPRRLRHGPWGKGTRPLTAAFPSRLAVLN